MSKSYRNSNNVCQVCQSVPAERQWLCKRVPLHLCCKCLMEHMQKVDSNHLVKPLDEDTASLDTELNKIKSDHKRDYFLQRCQEVSDNLESMVETRREWYVQQAQKAQTAIKQITRSNMTNLSKSKSTIMRKLEKLRKEALTSESNEQNLAHEFLALLPIDGYEKHVDSFFSLKEEFEKTDLLPQKRSKSDEIKLEGEQFCVKCKKLMLPNQERCESCPPDPPPAPVRPNLDIYCNCKSPIRCWSYEVFCGRCGKRWND